MREDEETDRYSIRVIQAMARAQSGCSFAHKKRHIEAPECRVPRPSYADRLCVRFPENLLLYEHANLHQSSQDEMIPS